MAVTGKPSYKILDLFCGPKAVARKPIYERYSKLLRSGKILEYTGIDAKIEGKPQPHEKQGHEKQGRLKENFIEKALDLRDPEKLEEQLTEILGQENLEKFDEIHVHMPPPFLGVNEKGPEALKVIAKFLKPGGFFYHVFQDNSPLINFQAFTPQIESYTKKAFDLQFPKINKIALDAGLKVSRYAVRTPGGGWFTGSSGKKTQERKDKAYNKLVKEYSEWFNQANHIAIMFKPKTRKSKNQETSNLEAEQPPQKTRNNLIKRVK